MIIRATIILLISVLNVAFACSQHAMSGFIQERKQENPNAHSFFTDKSDWREIIEKREMNSATWKHVDGRIMIEQCLRPLYFQRNGQLERIDHTLQFNKGSWEACLQKFPLSIEQNGRIHTAHATKYEVIHGGKVAINGSDANVLFEEIDNTHLIARNILPSVDKEMTAFENSVKYQYVLNAVQTVSAEYFEISETIVIPAGATIKTDVAHGHSKGDLWMGNFLVELNGEVISTIHPTLCFDQNKKHILAGCILQKTKTINEWQLITRIENAWLTDPTTAYPVIIDPLIVGPTAAWGNEFMPSCHIPNYNVDSMLVTVPGQITVTGLFVTASFFADPLANAIMDNGAMYFSTPCSQTGLFEAQPPADQLPGTAYLLSFDMREPLMCCYPPSCSQTSFYLRMHLGRYTPAGDCNANAVYYTPSSPWPFTAYIEGHTVEIHQDGWSIPLAAICSNNCNVIGKARMRYGVPPYTMTHPWMTGTVVIEQPTPCDVAGKLANLPLNIPGCPVYCPSFNSIPVPPCVITDVCGNVAPDVPASVVNIKPAPDVIIPPSEICSDLEYNFNLSSCQTGSSYIWAGNNTNGTGSIPVMISNPSTDTMQVSYFGQATFNGCSSLNTEFFFHVLPPPSTDFEIHPSPAFLNVGAGFEGSAVSSSGTVTSWTWSFDGNSGASGITTVYAFNSLGTHEACLHIVTENGCPATVCREVEVITEQLVVPNIFTPNGDGLNENLEFKNLEYFQGNTLEVYNRWGNLVFTKSNYNNNWNGGDLSEGTYYYILNVLNLRSYSGYVQLSR